MTTPDQILVLLLTSPSTPGAIGDALHIPMLVAKALAQREQRAGHLAHTMIADTIPLYHLTDLGREAAAALKPATA